MAKFGENITEFRDVWTHSHIPVTCVENQWFIKVGNCSVINVQDSKTLQTWKMSQEHLHSFTSSVAYFDEKLYTVMDKNVLLRWSIDDNNFENSEQFQFQEEVYSIIHLIRGQPLIIFKSGKFVVIDANTFFDLKLSDSVCLKDNDLQWADATLSETNIEVFYLTFQSKKKTWTLYYFNINKEDKSVSAVHTYNISNENSFFKSCCINQDLLFFTLWSDGNIRCYNVKDSKDILVLSLQDISRSTVVDINSIDSTHIVVARAKSVNQECVIEIWDTKGAILKGKKDLSFQCEDNIRTVASNDHIFVNAMYKLVAVPFVVDSTFFSTLNTSESKEFQQHLWNKELELVQIPAQRDGSEKMDTSNYSQDSQDSVEFIIEKIFNEDSSNLFLPEADLVKIMQLIISHKKGEKISKSCSGNNMYSLLNIIFSAAFNDSILRKYLKRLNVEDTVVVLGLLLSYLKQSVNIPTDVHEMPSVFQILNWIYLMMSSHREALFFSEERGAKRILKKLKKTLFAKFDDYEDSQRTRNFVSTKNEMLPQQYSLEKYCLESLEV